MQKLPSLSHKLVSSSEPEDEMESGLLLDVIVRQSPAVLQLFSSKDQPLLVWRDSFFVLDLGLHVFDGVRRLNLESNGLTGQGLHKDLHTSSETKNKMECGLLLDVIIGQSSSVFELFSCEDQPLLVRGDSFLVLDLGLHVLNGIGWLHLEGDRFTSQCLHEDLHTSSQPQDKMEGGLLLDVVVRQSPAVLQLFTSKDQSLLIWGDALLILDLSLYVLNGVRRLNLESDGLTSQRLYENLHTSSKPENEMECGLLLDVIVRESPAIFELFTSKDQSLLIWRDALLILDLGFHVLNSVRRLDLESDGLSSQRLHEDLHTSSKPQY